MNLWVIYRHYILILYMYVSIDIILKRFDTNKMNKTLDYVLDNSSSDNSSSDNSSSDNSSSDNSSSDNSSSDNSSSDNSNRGSELPKVTSDNELDFNFGNIIDNRKDSMARKLQKATESKKVNVDLDLYPDLKESNELGDTDIDTSYDDSIDDSNDNTSNTSITNSTGSNMNNSNNVVMDPTDSSNIELLEDIEEYQRIDDEINRDPDTMDAEEVIDTSVYEDKDKELNYKIIETKNTNKEILVSFMKLFIKYIKNTQFTYDEMNEDRIQEKISKEKDKQVRLNLETFAFLAKEGMEEDYKIIRDKMAIGEIQYKDLNNYMDEMFGDEMYKGEEDTDNRGNYDEDMGPMGEMNTFVGDPDEHNMEEQDYGYYMVD